jgi:hypothetical protein
MKMVTPSTPYAQAAALDQGGGTAALQGPV